jgi:chaperonin cofactor prefoldin
MNQEQQALNEIAERLERIEKTLRHLLEQMDTASEQLERIAGKPPK